jgi:hypothetical protein
MKDIEILRDSFQRINFETALVNLDTGNNRVALHYFHITHRVDSTNEVGEIAKIKFDSLLPIFRTKLLNHIKGTWKVTSKNNGWSYRTLRDTARIDKLLRITNDSLAFFERNKITKEITITSSEKIKFYTPKGLFPVMMGIIYSSGSVWRYGIDRNEILHTSDYGHPNYRGSLRMGCGAFHYSYIKED